MQGTALITGGTRAIGRGRLVAFLPTPDAHFITSQDFVVGGFPWGM